MAALEAAIQRIIASSRKEVLAEPEERHGNM
jgi:hypothetical protein